MASKVRAKLESMNLILKDVKETGKEIDRGSYGIVTEVRKAGELYAGKKLHEAIVQEETILKFGEECLLHCQQRHLNIVRLLGVHYSHDGSPLPMLVMEYLPYTLRKCLETRKDFPLQRKVFILHDVSKGLAYLHHKRPPIVHRDLTANNILLTSNYTAKISDLGVSRMMNTFKRDHLTKAPGTPIVMPPEALEDNPHYDHKLDVFSYGCLILHILINECPNPRHPFIRNSKNSIFFTKLSEWDRRIEDIQKIPKDNPLLPFAKQCLNDEPVKRPEISEAVRFMEREIRESLKVQNLKEQGATHPQVVLKPKPQIKRKNKIITYSGTNYLTTNGNIAAIELSSTTSISLAYTTSGDNEVSTLILDREDWSHKVPTTLLFTRERNETKLTFIGNTAKMKFKNTQDQIFFEKVVKSYDVQPLVESFSGEKFYLVEVIAFLFKYLKHQLVQHMLYTHNTELNWVFTVPATWEGSWKKMIREAAYLGGLLTDKDSITQFTPVSDIHFSTIQIPSTSERLSLAIEHEAVVTYCQEVLHVTSPSQYTVIDIREGTVSVINHSNTTSGILIEEVSTNNDWSGKQVTEAFSLLLQRIVSDRGFSQFLKSGNYFTQKAALNDILHKEFETQKHIFGQYQNDELCITLNNKFVKHYEKSLEFGTERMDDVEYDSGTLYISKPVIESELFGPAIDGIIECIMTAIKESKIAKMHTFYLVGGFKHVQQKVTEAIKRMYLYQCQVIIPPSSDFAVVKGAIMWRRKNSLKYEDMN